MKYGIETSKSSYINKVKVSNSLGLKVGDLIEILWKVINDGEYKEMTAWASVSKALTKILHNSKQNKNTSVYSILILSLVKHARVL